MIFAFEIFQNHRANKSNLVMGEFICGLFFFIVGLALLFHNKMLVLRSGEFHHRAKSVREQAEIILFNRILCILAGFMTAITGYLIMLYRK